MKSTALSIVLALTATSALADGLAGYEPVTFPVAYQAAPVSGALWYPTTGGGSEVSIGENGVFHGTPVQEGGTIDEGPFPVVLLSHGLGGNIRTLSWLSAGLAARGAVVVSVDHPNSTTADFDLRQGLDHWTRVQDLQTALDTLQANPRFAGQLDMTRVMATGFSYGGWTALSMAGVTGDLAGYAAHCDTVGAASSHCGDLAEGGINLHSLDAATWDASYKDTRITMVAAIDPALHYGLTQRNVVGLGRNVLLIGLGDGRDRLLATDFSAEGSHFAALVPDAKIEHIAPANHFSALLPCKPMGAEILKEEGDDPVCDTPEGSDRSDVHEAIIAQIATQLGL
ncbi:alpha/beta hydrolase family protein [Albirhodobacter sp. R86504]|uniref:alpha/beta hydrolase family protein n=1 Tax=Albirhodobacter sp. R86504 TaxID=3093848 RepID=UPI00366B8B8D